MASKKFYVVWAGHQTGVFDNWEDAKLAVTGFPGARYKAFPTPEEAATAYRSGTAEEDRKDLGKLLRKASDSQKSALPKSDTVLRAQARDKQISEAREDEGLYSRFPEIDRNGWAVDASCLGNPGIMEYQGVDLASGKTIFRVGPFRQATNNIGEYLAIIHALALMEKLGEYHTLYSDSKIAQGWVRKGRCNTKITPTEENRPVRDLIMRGDHWLATHALRTPIIKWDTDRWGEIPADFGRK